MKQYGLLGVLIGSLIALSAFALMPAVAQETAGTGQQANEPQEPEQRARRRGIPERLGPGRRGHPGHPGSAPIRLPEESAWGITVMSYGDGDLVVVKHNRITGQTLILSCSNTCGNNEEWRDYPFAE